MFLFITDKPLHLQGPAAQAEEMSEDWTILDPYSPAAGDGHQELPSSSSPEQMESTEHSFPVSKVNQGKFLTNLKKIKFGKRSQSENSVKNGPRSNTPSPSSPTASSAMTCSRCRNVSCGARLICIILINTGFVHICICSCFNFFLFIYI